jgi:phosphoribosyl-ATP pyrophosphohydrolase
MDVVQSEAGLVFMSCTLSSKILPLVLAAVEEAVEVVLAAVETRSVEAALEVSRLTLGYWRVEGRTYSIKF